MGKSAARRLNLERPAMNTMTDTPNLAVTGTHKMTPSEAFVETLVAHGVKDVFGIVGSAYMDALDLFPLAGIRFISVAHEQGGGHMADGYSRVSGRHGVCIAQNGPGITNFVTSVAAAYWAHTPVVVITPETGTMTLGLGGFQEREAIELAELLQAPVANSYLHNDSFPARHALWCGPLGYQGSKAAMKLISKADVVLALSTRLGPFGTLPQHGLEYWPKNAKIIQIDADAKMLGLVKTATVGICGDAKAAARALISRLAGKALACHANKDARLADVRAEQAAWKTELDGWAHEKDAWSLEVAKGSRYMHPRQMLRELER